MERSWLDYHLERISVYLVLSIFGGVSFGAFFSEVSFCFAGFSFGFGSQFGISFGFFFGSIFGILTYWPLRKRTLFDIFTKLALSTFIIGIVSMFSICSIFSHEFAPVAAWFGSMVGYWIGVVVVGLELRKL